MSHHSLWQTLLLPEASRLEAEKAAAELSHEAAGRRQAAAGGGESRSRPRQAFNVRRDACRTLGALGSAAEPFVTQLAVVADLDLDHEVLGCPWGWLESVQFWIGRLTTWGVSQTPQEQSRTGVHHRKTGLSVKLNGAINGLFRGPKTVLNSSAVQ